MRTPVLGLTGILSFHLVLFSGCGSGTGPTATTDPLPATPGEPTTGNEPPIVDPPEVLPEQPGREVSFALIRDPQTIDMPTVGAQPFDLLILEPSRSGKRADEFEAVELDTVRAGSPCDKQVLAYLNIAEAHDRRDYWNPLWVTGDGIVGFPLPGLAPAWLGEWDFQNPATYQVRYWDPDWQALILGTTGPDAAALDRIIDAGYDGVCLDRIAAFDYWSGSALRELSRSEARDLMASWVIAITEYARRVRGVTDFVVYVQNGMNIIFDGQGMVDTLGELYLDTIDGIVVENVFFDGETPKLRARIEDNLAILAHYTAHDKTVLVIDYVIKSPLSPTFSDRLLTDLYDQAAAAGLSPYAAPSDGILNDLLTLPGEAWSVSQPPLCP